MEISSNCGVSVLPSSGFQSFAFNLLLTFDPFYLHSPLTWVSSHCLAQCFLRKYLFDMCFFPQASPFICDLVVHIHPFFPASNILVRLDLYTSPSLCFSRVTSSTPGVFSWLAFSVCHNLLWWFYIKILFGSKAALRTHLDCVRSLRAKCHQPNRPFVAKAISERLWEDGFRWKKAVTSSVIPSSLTASSRAESCPLPVFQHSEMIIFRCYFSHFTPSQSPLGFQTSHKLSFLVLFALVLPGKPYHTLWP